MCFPPAIACKVGWKSKPTHLRFQSSLLACKTFYRSSNCLLTKTMLAKFACFRRPALRTINVPYLFVVGMSEKVFPAQPVTIVFIAKPNAAVCRMSVCILPGTRTQLRRDVVVLRGGHAGDAWANAQLSALDQAAQPLPCSPYLTELDRCCGEANQAN